ncbi:hypothetical protein [Candidatus Binatus sp.]
MIEVRIQTMPQSGSSWPCDARAQRMAVLEHTLDVPYPGEW